MYAGISQRLIALTKVCAQRTRTVYRSDVKPIPWAISFEMAFLPDTLTAREFDCEVRTIVRRLLPHLYQDMGRKALWEEYDERVNRIIEEELARN